MAYTSTLSPIQIDRAFRNAAPKPVSKRTAEAYGYDPSWDELLEAENFNRLASELEDTGQLPSYLRYLRSALILLLRDSPDEDDLPFLKGVVLYSRSPTLRRQALKSLQSYLLDCSGNRDATLKPDIQKLLTTLKEIEPDETRNLDTPGR